MQKKKKEAKDNKATKSLKVCRISSFYLKCSKECLYILTIVVKIRKEKKSNNMKRETSPSNLLFPLQQNFSELRRREFTTIFITVTSLGDNLLILKLLLIRKEIFVVFSFSMSFLQISHEDRKLSGEVVN